MRKNTSPLTHPARLQSLACCAALALGCVPPVPPKVPVREQTRDGLPVVTTPEIKATPAPKLQLGLLTAELRDARFSVSNVNVQRVSVTLKPRAAAAQTPREVFEQVITPFLLAVGFARGPDAFRLPGAPIPQPVANLKGAAQLLEEQYRDVPERMRPNTATMMDAALGNTGEGADDRLQLVTEFTVEQLREDFERVELSYPFVQVVEGVPIEHTVLVATRRQGETISQLTGTLIHDFEVSNERPSLDLDPPTFVQRALENATELRGRQPSLRDKAPVLVALPYGNAPSGRVALKHAWRAVVQTEQAGQPASFLAWIDAQTGTILKLEPLTAKANAQGNTWRRDPETSAMRRNFEVDPATDGEYYLRLDKVSERVDYQDNGYDSDDVKISGSSESSPPANFDQPPHNDPSTAQCGGNPAFAQINFFAWLQSSRQQALNNGIYTPFPLAPWKPKIEVKSCEAWSTMYFGVCKGHTNPSCPNGANEPDVEDTYLSYAHDGTIVAHEVGHEAVNGLTHGRPPTWCGEAPCTLPIGWGALHDLADAWADHLHDTNCVGGWVAKNAGGTNFRWNCVGKNSDGSGLGRHFEDSLLPRRHELDVVFQPAVPRDHFPEHLVAKGPYADMQVAAAVLWQLREGMASRVPVYGALLYFRQFAAALRETGKLSASPPETDLGIYTYLQDLETELLRQWTSSQTGIDRSTNEVLAAFARGGLFPMPAECLDGSGDTKVTTFCPEGEDGAEAVIDIDDNDLSDDVLIGTVRHVESDFLQLGGPAPTFHVWTGSRFRFAAGTAAVAGTAPCNSHFGVEASTDPAFAPTLTVSSAWLSVASACQGAWTPNAADWTKLQANGDRSKLYYRARTGDALESKSSVRSSTSPGNGYWNVRPPFAVLSVAGVPDF